MNALSHDSPDELEGRLQSLPRLIEDDPRFVQRVLGRIEAEGGRPEDFRSFRIGKWMMRSAIGLGAAGLIAVMIWSLWATAPRQAFAMEAVSKRMLSLTSLYVKGTMYPPGGGLGQTIELFLQQPGRCRINGRIGNGNAVTDLIVTPRQSITIDPATKTATIAQSNPEDAKEKVDQMLQSNEQMLVGSGTGFEKLRSEDLHGVATDLYENRTNPSFRIDVWLDPAKGFPVQTEMYEIEPGKPARLRVRIDTIQANPALPADIFNPNFPAGWTVTEAKAQPPIDGLERIYVGSLCVSVRFALSLGNGDVLICWCLFDTNKPGNDLNMPAGIKTLTFSAMDGTNYTQHSLHADPTPQGFHWRWSLLHPAKQPKGAVMLSVTAKTTEQGIGELHPTPVIYPPRELPEQVEELQRQTLPPGEAPMTLEQIESVLRK